MGTNKFSTGKLPSTVASDIIDLVDKYNKENVEITMSEIIERGDGLRKKGEMRCCFFTRVMYWEKKLVIGT